MTTGIFTPKECECPLDHSIVKLGHCRTCPYYGTESDTRMEPLVACAPGCGPRLHVDGTPHDFDYATYADDQTSYGVCRCGFDAMSESLWTGP